MDHPPRTAPTVPAVVAVVALKALPAAKSRMAALAAPLRERLARCMALDTLAALAPAVSEVVVISDQPDLAAALSRHEIRARVIADPDAAEARADGAPATRSGPVRGSAGDRALNRALAHGDHWVRTQRRAASSGATVLACVGDLPALRTGSVRRVLQAAATAGHPRSVLSDHADRGTTMLITSGVPLDPRFGAITVAGERVDSTERHRRSGAHVLRLEDVADARWDVDTPDDLAVAADLGVGPATRTLLDPGTGRLGGYLAVRLIERDTASFTVTEVFRSGPENVRGAGVAPLVTTLPETAYDGDPAHLVPGRRLHAVGIADALSCWD